MIIVFARFLFRISSNHFIHHKNFLFKGLVDYFGVSINYTLEIEYFEFQKSFYIPQDQRIHTREREENLNYNNHVFIWGDYEHDEKREKSDPWKEQSIIRQIKEDERKKKIKKKKIKISIDGEMSIPNLLEKTLPFIWDKPVAQTVAVDLKHKVAAVVVVEFIMR